MNPALLFYLCPERRISFDGFVNYEGRRFGVPFSYKASTARIMRKDDMIYIYSSDLKQLLTTHDVTFEEVLPCIRKTGGYMSDNLINELMNEPDIIYKITSDMLKERGQRMRLESEAKAAKPKVEYFDSFITAEDCTNIRTTAKEIQVPEKQFVAWLLKNKYLYRTAKGYLMPYAKKSNEGLFIVKDFYYGYGQIAHHTLITPNGKLLFMRLASRIRESA